ncbi:MAG TPA: D-alanyl-D-alanine endopeptidase [Candidatus Polarisedimenticolia bacterium]|nr:D-alanyl-D-alanine endopeptidase [Candidatus Polarisedimenticolia bacterium]
MVSSCASFEVERYEAEEGPLGQIARLTAVAFVIGSMMAAPAPEVARAATGGGSQSAGGAKRERSGPGRPGGPDLRSNVALVIDTAQGETLYTKHADQVAPIASITKLMTAMVVLDAQCPLDEVVEIDRADVDTRKHTRSRLPVGARLGRGELLWVALMASENRAASALAHTYPGGTGVCLEAMNRKARELGMFRTRFTDAAGLSGENVSSAEDLSRMVLAASGYPAIRAATTSSFHAVTLSNGRVLEFHNSDGLVNNKTWNIGLSKTGYINEAGRCLVLQAEIATRQVVIVLLDSWGKYTRLGDANRIRKWMEATLPPPGTAQDEIPRTGPARAGGARF